MALIKRRYLFEADDDEGGDTGSTPSDPTVTSTDSSSDDNSTDDASNNDTDDTSTDDSNDDSNSEDENSDDQDQNNDDEDYSIDAEPDADDSGDDSSGGDDNSSEDTSDNSDDSSEEKELDRQMFDTLSEDEKKRKIATLKKNFIDLHAKCDVLIEKFNQIEDEGNDDLDSIVKRILTILYDMKEYVSYYILNVFDKSSYIENDIMINRYISVLNGIKLTVEQLQKEKEKDNLQ